MTLKLILLEELALAGAPFGPLAGCDQTAESIIRYGSARLREEILPRIGRGEITFWQGFSEPNAGSDLLSLKTEARRDGDHYVIRGHKIWSSHAGIADYGLVLARTSREARRSQGLSMFVVANTTPGMDIRPIKNLTGGVYHYEVFLDEVRVPADLLLGREGEGFVQLLKGSTPIGSGGASTRPRPSGGCSASSWSTRTRPRAAARCSRAIPACAARSPPSPRRSRRCASSSIASAGCWSAAS